MQIYDQIRTTISGAKIAAGSPLPASRALAADLGVARSTVLAAYDQLVAEGYATTRPGAGIFVCEAGPIAGVKTPGVAKMSTQFPRQKPILPLTPGTTDHDLFPSLSWAKTVGRAARQHPRALSELTDAFGDKQLRQQIADHVQEWRGVSTDASQIIVTGGSGEALEIALRLTCNPGEQIGLEEPGYGPMRRFAAEYGLQINWLPMGNEGVEIPARKNRALNAIVLTPSHQFPLGGAMASGQRHEFLAYATSNNSWIIEDDFDSEFRYGGRPIPALAALDQTGRTIYVGGFSKVFSPGIRLGYLVVPEALTAKAYDLLRDNPTRASVVPQRPLAMFMKSGTYHRHLRRIRRVYGRRYSVLLAALGEFLPELGHYRRDNAGMQLAFHFSPNLKDTQVAQAALQANLGCTPLSKYAAKKQTVNGLLIGFCATPDDKIAPATHTLGGILRASHGLKS